MNTTAISVWLTQLSEAPWPLVILAKITLVLCLAWIAYGICQRSNPRWRVTIWRCAVVGVLAIPLLHWSLPAVKTSVHTTAATEVSGSAAQVNTAHGNQDVPRDTSADIDATGPHAWPVPSASDNSASPIFWQTRWFVGTILALIWVLGCVLSLTRMLVGFQRIRQLVNASSQASGGLADAFENTARDLAAGNTAHLRVSDRVTAPVLCGSWQPILLFPQRMARPLFAERWSSVFAHELSHVRSHDLKWNLLLHVTTSVLWFHPLMWFVRRAHAEACESVSDGVAADYVGDVTTYQRVLARVALEVQNPPAWGLAMARTSDVQRRIAALERNVFACALDRPRLILAVIVGGLCLVSLGGLKLVRAETPTPRAGSPPSVLSNTQQPLAKELMDAKTQAAANKALKLLVEKQREDGSFGGDMQAQQRLAITGLCGIAMLASGSKPGEGEFGRPLQKAVDYVVAHVQPDGVIANNPRSAMMYVHAYALTFLAKAHQANPQPKTQAAITKAVKLIVESQNDRDGWRYQPKSQDADSSVTACIVVALQASRRAKIAVPDKTVERALGYFDQCKLKDGGFSYIAGPTGGSAAPRSAAVMAALYLSDSSDQQLLKNGLGYLQKNGTQQRAANPFYFYTQYFMSTAMRYAGDDHFRKWYQTVNPQLLKSQNDDGSWNHQMGTEYATSCACIALLSPKQSVLRMPRNEQR